MHVQQFLILNSVPQSDFVWKTTQRISIQEKSHLERGEGGHSTPGTSSCLGSSPGSGGSKETHQIAN